MIKNNIIIENARIGFRNFSGKAGKFNPEGRRNFCVFLDVETGKALEEDGWNIRWLQPKDEEADLTPYLQVAVSYDNIPPKIVLVTSKKKTTLDAESVNILDWAEIATEEVIIDGRKEYLPMVDLIIRPYNWEVQGKKGAKAYVKNMYVTIVEDEFESKYYDVPDSAMNSIEDHEY